MISADTAANKMMNAVDRLAESYFRLVDARAAKLNLTPAESRCLRAFDTERYLTVKGLAKEMGLVKSRIVRLIDGLEGKGLVNRFPDPQDGRICLLTLTSQGKKLLAELIVCCDEAAQFIWQKLPLPYRDTLPNSLEQLTYCLEQTMRRN